MPTPTLSRDILLAALAGFQLDKQRIDVQIAEVQALLNGSSKPEPSVSSGTPKTRKRSAAVRKRMAEAQRARWAKIKGESEPSREVAKPKRQISPEGMKRIIAGTKKRWRLQKAKAATAPPVKQAVKRAAPAKAANKTAPKKTAVKKTAPAPAAPFGKSAGQ